MINQSKPGYKHTPLGWIPEEWEIKEIVSIVGQITSGVSVNGENRKLKEGEFGVLRISSVTYDYFNPDEYKVINKEEFQRAKVNPKAGTILMSRANTPDLVGNSVYVTTSYPNLFLPDKIWQLETKQDIADCLWLSYVLKSNRTKAKISEAATGTSKSMRNITQEAFLAIDIILPHLPEQRKVATIFASCDEAITKNKQLISQLQQRNKGLIQQLLSGRKRLKGFKREWKRLNIYDVAKEVSLKNRENKQLTVLSCTKYDGLVPSLEYFGRRVFGSDTSTYKVVPLGHFAYATNHIEEGSIGYQNIFEEALISPMYTVFKTDSQVHDDYLFKLLKSHHYVHEYCKRTEGSIDRRGGLRWDEFSKIVIHLPEKDEQITIAALINKAVEEIRLYEQKLATLQQQKKGLMQKLLTGEVRVKIKE